MLPVELGSSFAAAAGLPGQQQQLQQRLAAMPAWFVQGLQAPTAAAVVAAAAAAAAAAAGAGPQGGSMQQQGQQQLQLQAAQSLAPAGLLPRESLQQLLGVAGAAPADAQQAVARGGWVTQVADGGVIVQMPAGGPLQAEEEQQLMRDLSHMAELMGGGEDAEMMQQ